MPMISNDWKKLNYQQKKKDEKKKNQSTAEVFYRPEAGEKIVGRIVGDWALFIPHWARKESSELDDKGNAKWVKVDFPDAVERNYKPTRICTDDTPARERVKDMDKYLSETKCPWCRLKYQGYDGKIRYAFNFIIHPQNICRIIELPPKAMGMIGAIYNDPELEDIIPKDGMGSLTEKTFELEIHRETVNDWNINIHFNKRLPLQESMVGFTEEDFEALRKINPDAENEEDLLRGHDLIRWYAKDYMSGEMQRKMWRELGIPQGQILELSEYEKTHAKQYVVEEFEEELEELEDVIEDVVEEEEEEFGSDEEDDDDSLW